MTEEPSAEAMWSAASTLGRAIALRQEVGTQPAVDCIEAYKDAAVRRAVEAERERIIKWAQDESTTCLCDGETNGTNVIDENALSKFIRYGKEAAHG